MSLTVLALQVLLPVLLLVWLAVRPAGGWLAFALQLTGIGAILLGLALVALWTMPPYWVPYLYGAVFLAIVVWHAVSRRLALDRPWSAGVGQSALLALLAPAAALAVYGAVLALAGRNPPATTAVAIAPPFGPGTYLIAHGGSTEMVNAHVRTLDPTVPRYRDWRGQSYALDIFRVTPWGRHVEGWQPTDPARYLTYSTPVLAPCSGRIARVVDGLPDMPVPRMDAANKAGNYVAIDCGDAVILLAHLRPGRTTVETGQSVAVGDRIGEMGNSGNSSEPHLHLHAQRGLPDGAPFGGEPLALTIRGRFPVRNDLIRVNEP